MLMYLMCTAWGSNDWAITEVCALNLMTSLGVLKNAGQGKTDSEGKGGLRLSFEWTLTFGEKTKGLMAAVRII